MFSNREKGYGNLINLNEEQLAELCVILETLLKKDTLAITQQINYLRIFDLFQTVGYVKTQNTTTNVSQIVLIAIKYMDSHLTENITAKQLSTVCNVSVNTLERHFKKELGISPLAMLRKKRLIESIEYLRNGDTVSQAAIKCGFPDYSNFIQSFKSLFNMTPLQYKKSL
jgi:AraC-like DNA-binding protein